MSVHPLSGSSGGDGPLPANADAFETYEWLKRNRFYLLAEQLRDYTAQDLMLLSRNDLKELCEPKDSIRLYNMLHCSNTGTVKLNIFVTLNGTG